LLLLRHPQKPQGNTWGAPGGKIETGENPKEAVIREIREEIAVCLI
jgi:8-oxo-dGTP diphosphatase